MKLNIALATVALALVGASANAQLTFSVTKSSDVATFGGDTVFSGLLTNAGASPVVIDGSTLTSSVTGINVQDNFDFSDLAFTLAPGDSHTFGDLFELKLSGISQYSYRYDLTSGGPVVATASFSNIGTAVPEPGSIALLASGLVGGSLFAARRRK